MTSKEEELKSLLNDLQNSDDCRFQLDYYSEKEPKAFEWKCLIEGLQGSIYEGGYYMLKIEFPENYPIGQPEAYFLNKIFHPHVSSVGRACIHPPNHDIISVLESVENMFVDYKMNLNQSYSNEAARLLKEEKEDEFIKKAKEYVKAYAKLNDIEKYYDL